VSMTSPLPQNMRLRLNGRAGVIAKEGATGPIVASHGIVSLNRLTGSGEKDPVTNLLGVDI